VASRPLHGDVAKSGLEVDGPGLIDMNLADAGPEAAFAEATGAVKRRYSRFTLYL
jgi:hypothetical protein